jgi:hypothetical protein
LKIQKERWQFFAIPSRLFAVGKNQHANYFANLPDIVNVTRFGRQPNNHLKQRTRV